MFWFVWRTTDIEILIRNFLEYTTAPFLKDFALRHLCFVLLNGLVLFIL